MDTEYIFMAGAFGHGAGCYWFISHWGLWWQLLFLLCRHLGMVILEQFFLALGHGASGHSNLELGVLGRCFSCNLFAWSWADQSWAGAHGHCIGSNFADIYAGDSVKSAITEWQCLGYMHLVQWLFWCHTLGSNKGNRLLLWVYFGHYTASMNIFMAATQPIWGFAKGGLSWEVVCLHLWYSLCVRLWSGCRPQGGRTKEWLGGVMPWFARVYPRAIEFKATTLSLVWCQLLSWVSCTHSAYCWRPDPDVFGLQGAGNLLHVWQLLRSVLVLLALLAT